MAKKGKPRGTSGRHPTGLRPGERVSDYKRLTIRLPLDVQAELIAASGALRRPQWRVMINAIQAYVGSGPGLSEDERRVVRAVLRLHEKTDR
jgi:hypothetical protein